MNLNWPLMQNNITNYDLKNVVSFFCEGGVEMPPRLTQGSEVAAFESEFAEWLGIKHAIMVNSGSSANLITMMALAQLYGKGEVVVPTITWSSDIMSVLHAGLKPRFVDIDPRTLGMDADKQPESGRGILATFMTHCLGFSAFKPGGTWHGHLIEDCCESIGAVAAGSKLGTQGLASNFSFYYAHHMSTIEGGMVCTDDDQFYQCCRSLRAHGLLRESDDAGFREQVARQYPDLDPNFIFLTPSFNVRSTEINAIIGRSQLKRLDAGIAKRSYNLLGFLADLDESKYRIDYKTDGSSNYALPLILQDPDEPLMRRVLALLRALGVEYRRGTAGGGNQLRQPYMRALNISRPEDFPETEHVHFYGLYIGNFPDLEHEKIKSLCHALNAL